MVDGWFSNSTYSALSYDKPWNMLWFSLYPFSCRMLSREKRWTSTLNPPDRKTSHRRTLLRRDSSSQVHPGILTALKTSRVSEAVALLPATLHLSPVCGARDRLASPSPTTKPTPRQTAGDKHHWATTEHIISISSSPVCTHDQLNSYLTPDPWYLTISDVCEISQTHLPCLIIICLCVIYAAIILYL